MTFVTVSIVSLLASLSFFLSLSHFTLFMASKTHNETFFDFSEHSKDRNRQQRCPTSSRTVSFHLCRKNTSFTNITRDCADINNFSGRGFSMFLSPSSCLFYKSPLGLSMCKSLSTSFAAPASIQNYFLLISLQ